MAKKGLGRGLTALISPLEEKEKGRLQEIPVAEISPNPHQVRKQAETEGFAELVASIREVGLVQPVVVRPKGLKFELVAGERRWRAAKEVGFSTIPAVVKSPTAEEAMEIALIENLQREDLNALEEATAYRQLMKEFRLTQAELAKKVSKSRAAIANTLRLLGLSPLLKGLISQGELSSGHARALLSLSREEDQAKLARRIIKENLSVRQTESIISFSKTPSLPKRPPSSPPETYLVIAEKLSKVLSTSVKVKRVSPKKGKIEISFSSFEELEKIFKWLAKRRVSSAKKKGALKARSLRK